MATFVLIHGAWHGGWRYRELATGHDAMVTMPRDLAGLLFELCKAAGVLKLQRGVGYGGITCRQSRIDLWGRAQSSKECRPPFKRIR